MTADNEGVVRAFYDEFVNTGDRDAVLRLVDPEVMLYFGGQLVGTGPATFQQLLAVLRTAFPDLYTSIEHVVVGDDMVCERVVTRGTHLGTLTLPALPPIVATGRTIEMHGISMFQLRDGKITANWAMPDQLGLLRQVRALDGLACEASRA